MKSLRAFEAAGRHLSFRKAASELHVTPAAISHQIRQLEEHLGVQLFRRMTRAVELTEVGRAFLPKLVDAFEGVAQAVSSIRCYQKTGTLKVCAPPLFGAKWLTPRIGRFLDAFPDVDLCVSTSTRLFDLRQAAPAAHAGKCEADEPDVTIRFGRGHYAGCRVDRLFEVTFTPLCSPHLLTGAHPLRQPADLRHHLLLHDDLRRISDGWPSWPQWLQAAGVADIDGARGPHFSQPQLCLDAAIDGAGVLLGAREVLAHDIDAGRLVAPFALTLKTRAAYYVVSREDDAQHPKIAAFRGWLLKEARKAAGLGTDSPAQRLTT